MAAKCPKYPFVIYHPLDPFSLLSTPSPPPPLSSPSFLDYQNPRPRGNILYDSANGTSRSLACRLSDHLRSVGLAFDLIDRRYSDMKLPNTHFAAQSHRDQSSSWERTEKANLCKMPLYFSWWCSMATDFNFTSTGSR
ncbi:hypothetical protein MUK42_02764 [Musa troglodytarum]|uniref:Uncharacterized protein n=1 Tax=Musa troglodytarum TaxID=320322 RepID=A0A9E7F0V6_9LILI|nr:hypothetical protein MUK42_02764 [Musa troglodytarum]